MQLVQFLKNCQHQFINTYFYAYLGNVPQYYGFQPAGGATTDLWATDISSPEENGQFGKWTL